MKVADRNSGIELLKVLAIYLIIISHVTTTLNGIINIDIASADIQYNILAIFRHFGPLGNAVFWISSCWFLIKSSSFSKKKCVSLVVQIWLVSVIILTISCIIISGRIELDDIISSLFPTIFATNWYMTCYLLLYMLHPALNSLIACLNKKGLFRISMTMFVLYFGIAFVHREAFFISSVILWITIYFMIAYIQTYLQESSRHIGYNVFLLFLGCMGMIGIPALLNFLGLRFAFISSKVLFGASETNPFLLIVAISLFNLARNAHFSSAVVNYISKHSMLIYIIHENIILRKYFRPDIVRSVYERYGDSCVVLQVLAQAAIILVFSLICAIVFDKTAKKLADKISREVYLVLKKYYLMLERYFLMLK